jgi:hypothetical protein
MDATTSLQCGWAAVHLIGLTATFLMRAYAGARAEAPLQTAFLLGLAGVALATLAGEHLGWPLWIVSAFTLGAMIVASVIDVRPRVHEPLG